MVYKGQSGRSNVNIEACGNPQAASINSVGEQSLSQANRASNAHMKLIKINDDGEINSRVSYDAMDLAYKSKEF